MPFEIAFAEILAASQEAAAIDAAATAAAIAEGAGTVAATDAALSGMGAGFGSTGAAGTAAEQLAQLQKVASAVGGEGAGSAGIQQLMQSGMQNATNAATQGAGGLGAQVGGPIAPPGVQGTPPPPAGEIASRGITAAPAASTPPAMPPGVPEGYQGNIARQSMNYIDPTDALKPSPLSMTEAPSAFERGFDKFSAFADKHPFMTGMALYTGANKLGLFNAKQPEPMGTYTGPLTGYKMSKDFQGRFANPQDFQPRLRQFAGGGITDAMPVERMSNENAVGANTGYPQADINQGAYATPWQTPVSRNVVAGAGDANVDQMSGQERLAHGGIVSFAKGGDLTKALDFYRSMAESKASAPEGRGSDVGIYYDLDPDTRYQDPLTAAQIRQAKVNKRANMQLPTGTRPTPMGAINLRPLGAQAAQAQSSLDPENAAKGGIMQARESSLGGYAAGGNPRLLSGPGDGMSDDIPAMIGTKQPARLADGEFVVPADVVSHLGNGSTKAGAAELHKMMNKVRKARTGNPKQGKQINPAKYMPKK